ncbi:FAD-dependent oxidoreductase [Lacinutrix sp. Bg11-31]|uniref:FAD-dependent oxidoreductase n=1 Tax=Lacinutrix sp. Bg11-31 TaxID=2057808 RepID=UPI000C30D510|nr:FAD-dependent oxidoreductase [Lacinutrix sp. Bg11-31]AUC82105.1 FAD-dependent oxidoreductase [Lacinutrix sp. Bg11-31]
MTINHDIGIIGGGVSGVVIALKLSEYGIDTILFEKEESVVNGPPFCHLHAGGNLYPDISDEQCRILLKQSIEMARLFPQSIDERPTFISIPKTEKYAVSQIENRLDMLVDYYKTLIAEDPENEILGAPEHYYKLYNKADLQILAEQPTTAVPNTADEWMCNAIKLIDYNLLKTPVILVQEYGWNFFRLGAQAQLALNSSKECNLKTNTFVTDIKDVRPKKLDHNWEIHTKDNIYKVKYLVNSSGFKTGEIDNSLHLKSERLIEFKAAYVSKWQPISGLIPELIFHGERGTPHGMAQLTPYRDDYYQIHGMTNDITLFNDGIVQSKTNDAQPEFRSEIEQKLSRAWTQKDIETRTNNAIAFVGKFVPSFKSATVGGPPLYGAQQIFGDDPNLRVGEVRFPSKFYARSEIIKASSALTVANQIIEKIVEEGIVEKPLKELPTALLKSISKTDIDALAGKFAVDRGYPEALSKLVIDK